MEKLQKHFGGALSHLMMCCCWDFGLGVCSGVPQDVETCPCGSAHLLAHHPRSSTSKRGRLHWSHSWSVIFVSKRPRQLSMKAFAQAAAPKQGVPGPRELDWLFLLSWGRLADRV